MWQYNGSDLDESLIDKKAIGFIYIIYNNINNKKYVGRKLLTKAGYKTIKGVKKKIRKDNDWREYWSSSPLLLADIEVIIAGGGVDSNLKKEILIFCNSLSELNYYEEKLQYCLGVLESDEWYNSNIRAKVFKKNILNKVKNIDNIIKNIK